MNQKPVYVIKEDIGVEKFLNKLFFRVEYRTGETIPSPHSQKIEIS